uniref:Dilute domain-containing protein n=1 Tax=Malurus cyaneus samueli TaxID=2593467 RepID=A0A8C5TXN4_9PASS
MSCNGSLGSNVGALLPPPPPSGIWGRWLSPPGTVPAQELAQKLEKQEKTTLKLQKQLKAYTKQIQELAGGVPVWEGGMRLARGLQAGLGLIWGLQAGYKPQSTPGALPELPAYVLFLCLRHADHCHDEPRARSLLDAAIDAIKRLMKKHSGDLDTVALWLSNTCCLLNCLRQYGPDEGNTARQNEHRLRSVEPRGCCRSLGVLAVQLYQQLIRTAERGLKPIIVAAMLESEPIQGLSSSCPPGRRRSSSSPAHTLPELLQRLGSFCATLERHGLATSVGHQALRQLLFLVSGTTLNCLLLRKDMCSWSCGIQLRYNLSQLEQWLRTQGLQQSGVCEVLEPLVQAAQLLQVKKVTEEDAGALCSLCTLLTPQQVRGELGSSGVHAGRGAEERVSGCRIATEGPGQLLGDTSHIFPVQLPFTASSLHLDELHIPDTLNLAFLGRL